ELQPRTPAPETSLFGTNQAALQRFSGLIDLGALSVNGLIGLRFLLKLMAANPANPFAALVYFLSRPFIAIFVGLTPAPSFEGIQIEFFDLIAILVYFLLAWAVVRLLWILFARLRPS
ncbi:MAG TPA: hypothetical protein VF784_17985, partial [Anaerolineales bacterium]